MTLVFETEKARNKFGWYTHGAAESFFSLSLSVSVCLCLPVSTLCDFIVNDGFVEIACAQTNRFFPSAASHRISMKVTWIDEEDEDIATCLQRSNSIQFQH